jgi:hypothetical protein
METNNAVVSTGPVVMTMTLTTSDLEREGFSGAEIERLSALRAQYPVAEFFTGAELQRLNFLKWRREQGQL